MAQVLTTAGIGLAKYIVPWRVPPSAHHEASKLAQMKGTSVQQGRMLRAERMTVGGLSCSGVAMGQRDLRGPLLH